MLLECALDFPSEAIEAGLKLAESWTHGEDSLEQRIGDIETEISTLFNKANYGVQDAVMSGTRLRLLHQMDIKKDKVNCGEAGINLFLLYSALGFENIKLMRFRESFDSDHFALIYDDRGNLPVLLDPLFQRSGRVKITEKGFVYYPWNWLNHKEDPRLILETKDDKPKKVRCNPILLDKDDIIRHVNYINSSLGFLDYFTDGQRLREDVELELITEYNIKIVDDKLRVQAVFYDKTIEFFTFQRVYYFERDELRFSDKILIHLHNSWVDPKNVIYSSDVQFLDEQVHDVDSSKTSIAFIAYIRALKNGFFSSEKERGELVQEHHKMKTKVKRKIKVLSPELGNVFTLFLKNQDRIDDLQAVIRIIDSKIAYLDSLNDYSRNMYLDEHVFLANFQARKIKLEKPCDKFRPDENPLPVLRMYAKYRYDLFKDKIDSFFASDVVSKLLDQYKEAIRHKRIAESAVF